MCIKVSIFLFFFCFAPLLIQAEPIPNKLIDAKGFQLNVIRSQRLREQKRVTEDQFIEMAKDKNTIILDARSPSRFDQMHITGAKNLNFTDFTEDSLKLLLPSKETRILIYCNNNIVNSPIAFATKAPAASLNLSTYPSLFTYGYSNVYELGPAIDPSISKIKFEGTLVKPAS